MHKVNLAAKFASFTDLWSPKVVGELNGHYVKLAKVQGEFVWHDHEHEDEMFLVVAGGLTIEFRDHSLQLEPGEFCIVPRGVEHRPVSTDGAHIMLLEPCSTAHTGTVRCELTVDDQEHI